MPSRVQGSILKEKPRRPLSAYNLCKCLLDALNGRIRRMN